MANITSTDDPDEFVRENREELGYILRHGQDEWIRAMCLAMLVQFGDDPDLAKLQRDIEAARKSRG